MKKKEAAAVKNTPIPIIKERWPSLKRDLVNKIIQTWKTRKNLTGEQVQRRESRERKQGHGNPLRSKHITGYLPHLVEPNCSVSFQYRQHPAVSAHKLYSIREEGDTTEQCVVNQLHI